MMHYSKGENVEKEIKKEDLPFGDCMPKQEKDFLWMNIRGGTKINNVLSYAKNAIDKEECRTLVWSGSGGGVVKTISCAEILKRSYPLYQVTRMCYTTVEEHWIPQMDGLEEIVVSRQIPGLHILMSLDAINDSVSGLQKPNTPTEFWSHRSDTLQSCSNKGSGKRKKCSDSAKNQRNQPSKNQQQHVQNQAKPHGKAMQRHHVQRQKQQPTSIGVDENGSSETIQ